jgi:hypothetical protein
VSFSHNDLLALNLERQQQTLRYSKPAQRGLLTLAQDRGRLDSQGSVRPSKDKKTRRSCLEPRAPRSKLIHDCGSVQVGELGIRPRTLPPGRGKATLRFAILWNRMRRKGVLPDLPNVPAYCKVRILPYQDLLSKSQQRLLGKFLPILTRDSSSRRELSVCYPDFSLEMDEFRRSVVAFFLNPPHLGLEYFVAGIRRQATRKPTAFSGDECKKRRAGISSG